MQIKRKIAKNPNFGVRYIELDLVSLTAFFLFSSNFSSVYWTSFWHYAYGNCYVFNSGQDKIGKKAPVLKSNKPGPSHGKKAYY